jgi:hypothetical protein
MGTVDLIELCLKCHVGGDCCEHHIAKIIKTTKFTQKLRNFLAFNAEIFHTTKSTPIFGIPISILFVFLHF